ncbi:MAG: response regulator [Magnetococcus sp. DMHC-8]
MNQSAPLLRLITIIAAFVAGMVVVLPPLIHLLLGWDHVNKQLTTELRIHTLSLNKFISNNPDIWPAQGIRLKAVLEDAHSPGTAVRVFAFANGQEIETVQILEPLFWPRLTSKENLFDYGEVAGSVEITLSLVPALLPVLFTLLCSLGIGLAVFFPLRNVTLRTVQQATMALQEAKELAEETSRIKSEFLANMSHEIRTPMNAIMGLADLALRMEMTPRLRDYLSKIANASHSLLRIINDILDFSKAEAGKITLESTDFEMGRVCENLADLFRDQVDEKNLELVMGMDPACPTALRGDSLRLEQVLMNLIGNAIKFTAQGSIRVWVTMEPPPADTTGESGLHAHDDRVVLVFTVQDSGIGMSQAQVAGLFRPFSQADNSTTRQYGGTGLGLSICKHLVEVMGGRIWVETAPGGGSLFGFTAAFIRRPQSEQLCLAPPDVLDGLPILVVDDNAIAREILEITLRSFTFRPVLVTSGADAVTEMARSIGTGSPYPLVLLDYQMPGMDGIETAHQIISCVSRHARNGFSPKMILLSAFAREEDLLPGANQAGIEVFLSKPVTRSRLFDTIMDVLGHEVVRSHRTGGQEIDPQGVLDQIGGARVLLVEDNPINQQVAREMLEQVGLVVTVVNNGLEATHQVLASPFDMVFMDIHMPVMDGYTAVRQIRSDAHFAQLPIIAMTAHAMEGDRQRSFDVGMNGHVTKPIDRKQLHATLLQWIKPGDRPRPEGQSVPSHLPMRNSGGQEVLLDLPGVDVSAGLERLGGNRRLFRSLLLQAGRDFSPVAAQLRHALQGKRQDDLLAAKSLVHTLKGVAGNVSAISLHKAAIALEQAMVADQKERYPDLLDHLERLLIPFLEGIRILEQDAMSEPTSPNVVSVDPVRTRALLTLLATHIQNGNTEAEACFAELKSYLQGSASAQDLAQLEAAIEQFDFPTAQTVLAAISQIWHSAQTEGSR